MCKYCEIKDIDDIDEGYSGLAHKGVSFGSLMNYMALDLCLNKIDHRIECELVCDMTETAALIEVDINYCPMCGREL